VFIFQDVCKRTCKKIIILFKRWTYWSGNALKCNYNDVPLKYVICLILAALLLICRRLLCLQFLYIVRVSLLQKAYMYLPSFLNHVSGTRHIYLVFIWPDHSSVYTLNVNRADPITALVKTQWTIATIATRTVITYYITRISLKWVLHENTKNTNSFSIRLKWVKWENNIHVLVW